MEVPLFLQLLNTKLGNLAKNTFIRHKKRRAR